MLPTELNATSDEVLFALIDGAVISPEADGENLQPLAPFVTLELLRRVHEQVVHLKRSGRTSSTKHKLLARAILRLTGVAVPPDDRDVDKIGNHLDIWLSRRYIQADKKICKNIKDANSRANKRAALMLQCLRINKRGGVVEHIPSVSDGSSSSSLPQRAPHVPYTQTCLPAEASVLKLKDELNQARENAKSVEADLNRERERCKNVKRRFECAVAEGDAAMKLVELANSEKLQISRLAEQKVKQMRTAGARMQRESALALRNAEAKLHRLGGQAAAAAQEAAQCALREEKLKSQLMLEQERAELEAHELRMELARLRSAAQEARREASRDLRDAEAKVLFLGSQVAAALQEATLHAQKEEKVRIQLEAEQERADAAVEQFRVELSLLRSDSVREKRELLKSLRDAEAKVLRLGSQVAVAAQV